MRRFFKRLGIGLLVIVLGLAALAYWKRAEVTRLMALNSLFDADRIVANFSSFDTLFDSRPMDGGHYEPLPEGMPITLPEGYADWAETRQVTGIAVLSDGALVHEDYRLGTARDDLRISWSVAKSVLSLLLGTLVDDGTIPDLDAPVTDYAPALRGSAYDRATIRQVAMMASGVAFDEDYLDFWSDINRMGRVLALGGAMDGFAAGQSARRGAPGADWQYVSIDTHVLGMVIRGASGRSIPELVEERLFRPLGLMRAPFYVTDGHGVAFVLGGLSLTTRDYARIGQLVLNGGAWNGRQLVSRDWLAESTAPQAPGGALYGYQWWMPDDSGAVVYARGVYGQFVWIDRSRDVVIAVNSADRAFLDDGVLDTTIAMLNAISASASIQRPQTQE